MDEKILELESKIKSIIFSFLYPFTMDQLIDSCKEKNIEGENDLILKVIAKIREEGRIEEKVIDGELKFDTFFAKKARHDI
jgi:hypothetical protein